MSEPITCTCGQQIPADAELIRYPVYSLGQPRYYVKFQCPKCGRIIERYIEGQDGPIREESSAN